MDYEVVNYQLGSLIPGFSSQQDVGYILGPVKSRTVRNNFVINEYSNVKFTWAQDGTVMCSFKDNILERVVFTPTQVRTRQDIVAKKGLPFKTSTNNSTTIDVYSDGWIFVFRDSKLSVIILTKPQQVNPPIQV